MFFFFPGPGARNSSFLVGIGASPILGLPLFGTWPFGALMVLFTRKSAGFNGTASKPAKTRKHPKSPDNPRKSSKNPGNIPKKARKKARQARGKKKKKKKNRKTRKNTRHVPQPQDVWLSESADPADMVKVAESIDSQPCRRSEAYPKASSLGGLGGWGGREGRGSFLVRLVFVFPWPSWKKHRGAAGGGREGRGREPKNKLERARRK